jgi:putative inorganic carbon (HCO3(-)) transporter
MSTDSYSLSGSEFKTNWPLLLLIILMPLRNIQLQYIPNLGGGINIINVLFLLSLFHSFIYGKKLETKPSINGLLVWYILSSVIALFFGYAYLISGAEGLWKVMKDSLIPVFMVFIVQRSVLDEVQWRRVLIAMLVPLPYIMKVVWNQYQSVSSWHYSDDLRISGTFMDLGANEMGAFSVMMAMISLGCLLTCWSIKKYRYIFLVCFISASVCLLYSYSRGGYISFILGAIFIIKNYEHRKKMFTPLMIVVVLFLFNLPKSVEERFSTINASDEERDESADSRFVFWGIVLTKYLERPIQGFGYHTAQDKRINPHEMDTHNYYVKMLVERGIIGFLTFILLLRAYKKLITEKLKSNNKDLIKQGVILGMVGVWYALILGNMFGDRFSHYPISTNLWVLIGLLSIISTKKEDSDDWSPTSKKTIINTENGDSGVNKFC